MSKVEGKLNREIGVSKPSNYEIRLEATRAYFDGKLSLRAYQDFKNKHPFFPSAKIGPSKTSL